jgi:hypothetical protein
MGNEIVLKLTPGEAYFLSQLLSKSKCGYSNDIRKTVIEKLEGERNKALKNIINAMEGELNG